MGKKVSTWTVDRHEDLERVMHAGRRRGGEQPDQRPAAFPRSPMTGIFPGWRGDLPWLEGIERPLESAREDGGSDRCTRPAGGERPTPSSPGLDARGSTRPRAGGASPTRFPGLRLRALALTVLLIVVTLGIGWLVWSVLEWRHGRTPAYRMLGVRVVRHSDGRRVGCGPHGSARALLRPPDRSDHRRVLRPGLDLRHGCVAAERVVAQSSRRPVGPAQRHRGASRTGRRHRLVLGGDWLADGPVAGASSGQRRTDDPAGGASSRPPASPDRFASPCPPVGRYRWPPPSPSPGRSRRTGASGPLCRRALWGVEKAMEFHGKIGDDWRDSEPWWPPVPTPPEGAPNVVLIVLDDVGIRAARLLRVRHRHAEDRRPGRTTASGSSNFHTTALCSPTPGLPDHGAEPSPQRHGPRGRPGDRFSGVLGPATSGERLPLGDPPGERVRHLCRRQVAPQPRGRDEHGGARARPGRSAAGSTAGTGSTAVRPTSSSRLSTTTTTPSDRRARSRTATTSAPTWPTGPSSSWPTCARSTTSSRSSSTSAPAPATRPTTLRPSGSSATGAGSPRGGTLARRDVRPPARARRRSRRARC